MVTLAAKRTAKQGMSFRIAFLPSQDSMGVNNVQCLSVNCHWVIKVDQPDNPPVYLYPLMACLTN